jgi:hypothetical protein
MYIPSSFTTAQLTNCGRKMRDEMRGFADETQLFVFVFFNFGSN